MAVAAIAFRQHPNMIEAVNRLPKRVVSESKEVQGKEVQDKAVQSETSVKVVEDSSGF